MLELGMLLGGVGLFLLAVGMITDGLKLAAGSQLKDILGRYTRTPLHGVASGLLITGVMQSSSAVTVATIGFVNAGLLTLNQALGVVYGANIGTSMTGWLVATVGFGFKLEAFALPLVGAGMLARLLGGGRRAGALGEAVAGFGLFFVGIDILRDAFTGVAAAFDVARLAPAGVAGIALYVGIGFVATVLTQSSSAAIALILTAASSGALALNGAAAMVIGANVGTTTTAALATIGATANARRVAAAHVLFNVVTAIAALALLPLLLWAVGRTGSLLGVGGAPAATLALFHTLFNVLGVALMWPATGYLVRLLQRRFVTDAESLARPQFLDRTVLVTPTLALEALKQELRRAAELTRLYTRETLSRESVPAERERQRRQGIADLLSTLEDFVTRLEIARLPPELAGELPLVLRVVNYLEDTLALTDVFEARRGDLDALRRGQAQAAVAGFLAAAAAQLDACDTHAEDFERTALEQQRTELERHWHELKTVLLTATARREVPVGALNGALEALRSTLRMAEQLTKATLRLDALEVPSGPPREAEAA